MKYRFLISSVAATAAGFPAWAQYAPPVAEAVEDEQTPLVANREADSMAIAEQMYAQSQTAELRDRPVERGDLLRRAASLFADFAARYPQSSLRSKALYYQAACLMDIGDVPQANLALAEIATKYQGRNDEFVSAAAYKLAAQSAEEKNWSKAERYYTIALQNTTKPELKTDIQFRLGRTFVEMGDQSRAEAMFRNLLATPGVSAQLVTAALSSLGPIYVASNRPQEAYDCYVRLSGQSGLDDKRRGAATLQAARLASQLGRAADAQQLYARLSSIPGMSGYVSEGAMEGLVSLYRDKNYAEIVRRVHAGMQPLGDPRLEARRCLIIGQAFMQQKQYAPAMEYFAMVEQVAPQTESALDAAYRRLVCAQESNSFEFLPLAEHYLQQYAAAPAFAGNPTNDVVRFMYADRLLPVNAPEAVRQYGLVNVDNLPENVRPDVALKKAWALSQSKDPADAEKAAAELGDFINKYGKDKRVAQAYLYRGEVYYKAGKEDLALADFEKVISGYGKTMAAATAWQRAAQICARKDPDKMIRYYQGLLENFPQIKPAAAGEAHFAVAQALYEKDRAAEAVPHFHEARTINGEKYGSQVGMYLALCYYKLQDSDKLLDAMEALERENNSTFQTLPLPIHRWLGWKCYQTGNYEAADKYLTIAVQRPDASAKPADSQKVEPVVWKTLAKARLALEKYPDALKAVDQYLGMETKPYFRADAMLDRSAILLGLGKTAEARKVAEEAIAMGVEGPLKASLRLALGDASFAEKKYGDAAKFYGTTAELFVSDKELKPKALYKAVRALMKDNRPEEAKRFTTILEEEFPGWRPDAKTEAFMK